MMMLPFRSGDRYQDTIGSLKHAIRSGGRNDRGIDSANKRKSSIQDSRVYELQNERCRFVRAAALDNKKLLTP